MRPIDLADWRDRHGYTQKDLAVALNVPMRTIQAWEGKQGVTHPTLVMHALIGLMFEHADYCHCGRCDNDPVRQLTIQGHWPTRF